jgi:hypothetical protein
MSLPILTRHLPQQQLKKWRKRGQRLKRATCPARSCLDLTAPCYGKLIEDLENDFIQGQDSYPKILTSAYNLMVNWKQNPNNLMHSHGSTNDQVAFATTSEGTETENADVALTTNSKKKRYQGKHFDIYKVKCHKCQNMGHYANDPECAEAEAQPTEKTSTRC